MYTLKLVLYCLIFADMASTKSVLYPPGWLVTWPGHLRNRRRAINDTAVIWAWPSTGGRLELHNQGAAFELDHSGIVDHLTECDMSNNVTEEDAFGIFCEYQYGFRHGEEQDDDIHTWLCWPEDDEQRGGAWVLKARKADTKERVTGRIRLASTMGDAVRRLICVVAPAMPNLGRSLWCSRSQSRNATPSARLVAESCKGEWSQGLSSADESDEFANLRWCGAVRGSIYSTGQLNVVGLKITMSLACCGSVLFLIDLGRLNCAQAYLLHTSRLRLL
jgi:hypothetical protein